MTDESRTELFSRLLVANQRRLYAFIFTLVHDHAAADEVLQETATVLWRKFEQFKAGTDFGAWAMKVARLCVFEWRRKQARLPLPMGDDLFEAISAQAFEISCDLEARFEALDECVASLSERDQGLLSERYEEDVRVADIAKRRSRSRGAIYKILTRIHRDLLACIETKLAEDVA